MQLSNPFRTDSVETPVFFLSTVFVCAFEILGHLTSHSPPGIQIAVLLLGAAVLFQGVDCLSRMLFGNRPAKKWYLPQYRIMATLDFLATFTVVLSTPDNAILYLPILVGLCLKNFGYIVKSPYIRTLGTVMLLGTLLLSGYRAVFLGFSPLLFLLTYGVSIFSDLLIESLEQVHRRFIAIIEDKAEAMQAVHELMMGTISAGVADHLESMQVLATEEYRGNTFLFLMTMGRHTGNVNSLLASSGFGTRTRDPIQEVVSKEFSREYSRVFHVDFRGMSVATSVEYHRLFLTMVVRNVVEHACRVADSNKVGGLSFSVNMGPYGLIMEDNAGQPPEWKKERERFLRTVTDTAVMKMFGQNMQVVPTTLGTRYIVTITG